MNRKTIFLAAAILLGLACFAVNITENEATWMWQEYPKVPWYLGTASLMLFLFSVMAENTAPVVE